MPLLKKDDEAIVRQLTEELEALHFVICNEDAPEEYQSVLKRLHARLVEGRDTLIRHIKAQAK